MSDTTATLTEIEGRIEVLESNLRDLTEQAAAYSGGANEDRSSDRIAELQHQLDALKAQRDELT